MYSRAHHVTSRLFPNHHPSPGPGAALDTDTNEKLVSKEVFVSIAPNGTATVDGEVSWLVSALSGGSSDSAAPNDPATELGKRPPSVGPPCPLPPQDIVAAAARSLQAAGYSQLSELAGGYRAWDLSYRPDGRRRAKGAFRDKSSGELEFWTASN